MSDATEELFERLGGRGRDPLFGTASGSVAFELTDGEEDERWVVSVSDGHLTVSRGNGSADCTVRASKDVFDGIAAGEVNAMAAVIRGEVVVEGDTALLPRLQRLFPGRPATAAASSVDRAEAARP